MSLNRMSGCESHWLAGSQWHPVSQRAPVLLLALALALSGCGHDSAPSDSGASPAGGKAAAEAAPSLDPDTPDGAIRLVIAGMQEKRPEALWNFLPASYQKDLNDLVHHFAERMDPDLWDRSVQSAKKLSAVLKSKRKLLEGKPEPGKKAALELVRADLDAQSRLIDTLLISDLRSLERLKSADVGDILRTTGGRLMEQFGSVPAIDSKASDAAPLSLGDLAHMNVTLRKSSGDRATVKIEIPDTGPRDFQFVRVEGKWIPQNLADSWIEAMGQARAMLSILSADNLAEWKPKILDALDALDAQLDRLAASTSPQEFTRALESAQPVFDRLGRQIAGILSGAPPDEADEAASPRANAQIDEPRALPSSRLVTIVVRGSMTNAEQEDFGDRLCILIGDGAARAELASTGELTTIRVGPIDDVAAFAQKIEFAKVVEVDESKRMIVVELTE